MCHLSWRTENSHSMIRSWQRWPWTLKLDPGAKPKSIVFLFSCVMFLNPLAFLWQFGKLRNTNKHACDTFASILAWLWAFFGQLIPSPSIYPPLIWLLWEGIHCSTGNPQVTMQPRIFSMMGAVSAFEPTSTRKVAAFQVFRVVSTF